MNDSIAHADKPAPVREPEPMALGEGEVEADYALEVRAVCPGCRSQVESVQVIRLLRTRVNFVSSLPRRGHVMVCSSCRTVLSGTLGGLL